MKVKIICILLMTLLIVATVLPAAGIKNENKNDYTSEPCMIGGGTFEIKQWGIPDTYIVDPIERAESAVDFYDYYSASGHTPFMEERVSKIYLYRDTTTDEISIIMHHDKDESNCTHNGVDFNLDGLPAGAYISLADDDENEFNLSNEPEGRWRHQRNSDGGVLSGLPTDVSWDILITPEYWHQNITDWYFQLEDRKIWLDKDTFLRISFKAPCGIVDQEQPNKDEIHWLEHTVPNWQQFVNQGTMLCAVELHIGCYFGGSPAITLSIEEPLNNPLTQITYAATDLPDNTQAWFSFDVPDVQLDCNKMYYIVLRFDPGAEYAWSGSHNDPYPAGDSSHPDNDWDYAFRTIVNDICSPPSAPEIDGPTEGNPNVMYAFTFHSSDDNGDLVRYHIDWGDGSSEVTDFYPACTPVTVYHTYTIKGTYTITAYAEDETGLVSPSSSFTIVIPRDKAINRPILNWFQCHPNLFPLLQILLTKQTFLSSLEH